MTHARPAAEMSSARRKSWVVATNRPPSEHAAASTTSNATSADRSDASALPTASFSAPSGDPATDARRRTPAVSTRTNRRPSGPVSSASTESLVVPAASDTTDLALPSMALSREDLPALGRPTIAIRSGLPSGSPPSGRPAADSDASIADFLVLVSGSASMTRSSKSPDPDPDSADTGTGSTPVSHHSATAACARSTLSHLLAASRMGRSPAVVRSQERTSESERVTPAGPSTTISTASASATAAAVAASTAAGRPAAVSAAVAAAPAAPGSAAASAIRPPVSTTANSFPPQ